MKKAKMLTFTLWPLLLISCASNQNLVRSLSEKAYAESRIEEPIPPKPFRSDGCSCWPDGDWVDCCVRHDLLYWMGGTSEERKQADLEFMKCLEEKGHSVLGGTMYIGVRIGGVWWLPTSFRWGFGWPYPDTGPPAKSY